MASLPDVIGLLYRADWTRLSLSADVRVEVDLDLLHRRIRAGRLAGYRHLRASLRPGRPSERAALLIAPGGRYRLEDQDGHGIIEGNDGERGWEWRPGPPILRWPTPISATARRSPSFSARPACSAGTPSR